MGAIDLQTPQLLNRIFTNSPSAATEEDSRWLSTGQPPALSTFKCDSHITGPCVEDSLVSTVIRQLDDELIAATVVAEVQAGSGAVTSDGGATPTAVHARTCSTRTQLQLHGELETLTQQLKASQSTVANVSADNQRLQQQLGVRPLSPPAAQSASSGLSPGLAARSPLVMRPASSGLVSGLHPRSPPAARPTSRSLAPGLDPRSPLLTRPDSSSLTPGLAARRILSPARLPAASQSLHGALAGTSVPAAHSSRQATTPTILRPASACREQQQLGTAAAAAAAASPCNQAEASPAGRHTSAKKGGVPPARAMLLAMQHLQEDRNRWGPQSWPAAPLLKLTLLCLHAATLTLSPDPLASPPPCLICPCPFLDPFPFGPCPPRRLQDQLDRMVASQRGLLQEMAQLQADNQQLLRQQQQLFEPVAPVSPAAADAGVCVAPRCQMLMPGAGMRPTCCSLSKHACSQHCTGWPSLLSPVPLHTFAVWCAPLQAVMWVQVPPAALGTPCAACGRCSASSSPLRSSCSSSSAPFAT